MQDVSYLQTSGFFELAKLKMASGNHELTSGMNCVATGMNFFIYNAQDLLPHPVLKEDFLKQYIDDFNIRTKGYQSKWEEEAKSAPSLYEYLKNKYDKD